VVAAREIALEIPSGPSAAASSLTCALLDGPAGPLPELVRTRVSVHYETADPRLPVLAVVTPAAVRLPNSVVVGALPRPGPLLVGDGALRAGAQEWRVTRWWRPARPAGLVPRRDVPPLSVADGLGIPLPAPTYDGLRPATLVGAGPGLTPAGDDVLAGALVAASATADPRLAEWRRLTRAALASRSTTAVSRGLLEHAVDGYACAQLADAVTSLCQGAGSWEDPVGRLLAVGHSSGAALLTGVLHTLTTRTHEHRKGAA
jgi:hypothetical protein